MLLVQFFLFYSKSGSEVNPAFMDECTEAGFVISLQINTEITPWLFTQYHYQPTQVPLLLYAIITCESCSSLDNYYNSVW